MIKQLRTFFLFIVLFAMSSPLIGGSGIADKWAAGGWVSVKSQSNNKYEVTCNMLYACDNNKDLYNKPTPADWAMADTSVVLRVYDSSGNYFKLDAPHISGYYYTQKDTSKSIYQHVDRQHKVDISVTKQSYT